MDDYKENENINNDVNPELSSEKLQEETFDLIEETEESSGESEESTAKSFKKEFFEWVQAIAIAVVLALLIRTFVFTLVKVDGSSMVPTLQDGDRLYVTRLLYKPKASDVIVFRPAGDKDKYYVKRVIATEGQEVDINFSTGAVMVDGVVLDEPYINELTYAQGNVSFPVTVPKDCVFVLGDNRNRSKDSRFSDVYMVSEDSIMGGAVFRLFPFNAIGKID